MICNLICVNLFLGIKQLKMSNQTTYIPLGGIGEREFDVRTKDWYKCDTTEFNADKTIPFINY